MKEFANICAIRRLLCGVLLVLAAMLWKWEIYSTVGVVVQVIYNPGDVKYERLLDTFFEHVDPTTKNRQGNDVGSQYRSAIYYHTPEQKSAAEKVRLQHA